MFYPTRINSCRKKKKYFISYTNNYLYFIVNIFQYDTNEFYVPTWRYKYLSKANNKRIFLLNQFSHKKNNINAQ